MANFSQNITNTVNVFGNGPSTKWGQAVGVPYTMTWGTSKWGEGESIPVAFIKVISNSQALTWDYARAEVRKVFEIGSTPVGCDPFLERLSDGSWNYVFVSDTTDAEERDFSTWTSATASDATFTCQAAAGTSWSEL